MNCFTQIREAEKSYTATEKVIAQYILNHSQDVLTCSALTLGKKTGTSAAAIIRFSQKLGFKGFSEFKVSLAQSKPEDPKDISVILEESDSLDTLVSKCCQINIDTVEKTYQMINLNILQHAIDLINHADTVYLFGVGASAVVADDFAQKLARIGKKVAYHPDLHLQATFSESMTEKDAAVFITYSGKTRGIAQMSKKIKGQGIPIISITQMSKNPVAKLADAPLYVPVEEKEIRIGAISSRTASLVMTDLLYYGVLKLDFQGNMEKVRASHQRVKDMKL